MAHSKYHYELSLAADNDLEEIYDFTNEKFGAEQAVKYLIGLENVFDSLCSNPRLGRERNELYDGLRSFSKESHVIFYRIMENRIRIVRVLHANRDAIRFLRFLD